jgi:hypothetical protein
MNRIFLTIIGAGLLATLLSGCGSTAKFVYPSNMKNLERIESPTAEKKNIAILPFDDYRKDENSSTLLWIGLIPLCPYGWVLNNRPEAARSFASIEEFDMNVSEDLAKATAVSLRRSNLFSNAFFTFGGEKDKADYVLNGKINYLFYKGRIFTYGISVLSPIFWGIGFPYGTSLDRISVTLTIKNAIDNKIVWEYTVDKEDYYTQWVYSRMGWDARLYAKLYENGMNEAVLNLAKTFKEIKEKEERKKKEEAEKKKKQEEERKKKQELPKDYVPEPRLAK